MTSTGDGRRRHVWLDGEILPAEGSYPGMKRERSYEVRLPFAWPPTLITWQGVPVPWRYDGDRLMTVRQVQ